MRERLNSMRTTTWKTRTKVAALVRLSPDLANHDGCHAHLVTLSTSSGEETAPPENDAEHTTNVTHEGVCRVSSPNGPQSQHDGAPRLGDGHGCVIAPGAAAVADPGWHEDRLDRVTSRMSFLAKGTNTT